jgi:hypothetical protein
MGSSHIERTIITTDIVPRLSPFLDEGDYGPVSPILLLGIPNSYGSGHAVKGNMCVCVYVWISGVRQSNLYKGTVRSCVEWKAFELSSFSF